LIICAKHSADPMNLSELSKSNFTSAEFHVIASESYAYNYYFVNSFLINSLLIAQRHLLSTFCAQNPFRIYIYIYIYTYICLFFSSRMYSLPRQNDRTIREIRVVGRFSPGFRRRAFLCGSKYFLRARRVGNSFSPLSNVTIQRERAFCLKVSLNRLVFVRYIAHEPR